MKKIKNNQKKGFTLIELLVVISIIGVLAMMIVPNLVGMRQRARDAKKKSELVELKKALRIYYNDNQSFPTTSEMPSQGNQFSEGDVVYIQSVPEYDEYAIDDSGDSFVLRIRLENTADSDIASSQAKCDTNLFGTGFDNTSDYVVCQD